VDPRFDQIYGDEANEIFRVVFFPDRIYHARYLSATRSSRYRYDVTEVRGSSGITVMKGDVYMGGSCLCGMLRVEYAANRLVEQAREVDRLLGPKIKAWVKAMPDDASKTGETTVTLHYDAKIGSYAVELWETLEPPVGMTHDHRVLAMMGRDAPITRASELAAALSDLPTLGQVACAFREADTLYPTASRSGTSSGTTRSCARTRCRTTRRRTRPRTRSRTTTTCSTSSAGSSSRTPSTWPRSRTRTR